MRYFLIGLQFLLSGINFLNAQEKAFSTEGWWEPEGEKFSPVVHEDRSITFRLNAPQADNVTLLFGEWDIVEKKMKKDDLGNWSINLKNVESGIYQYNFLINNSFKKLDPVNPNIKVGTNIYGSIVEVPDTPARFDQLQEVPHGEVHIITYRSIVLDKTRKMYVYVPKIYQELKDVKFPVLYLRHGGGDNEGSWINDGRANIILDNLISQGKSKPMLIVMSNGLIDGSWSSGSTIEGMNTLEEELINDIIPLIENRYHVSKNKKDRAIAGLSMGGGQSVVIGLRNPNLFSFVGDFSAGLLSDPDIDLSTYIPDLFKMADSINQNIDLLWISCGSKDPRFLGHKKFHSILNKHGIKNEFHQGSYGHEWQFWRSQLKDFSKQIFIK
ncbi:esterase [Zunongwangia profunda]|nr:esterase [Zunongwangia profunda]